MLKFLLVSMFILGQVWFVSHPLVLCLGLVFYSVWVGVFMFWALSLWAMITVVLIFLGGMMVILLYVSTLTNSDKFILYGNKGLIWFIFPFMLIISGEDGSGVTYCLSSLPSLSSVYKSAGGAVLYFMVFYLLYTLILVVKFTESFKGALTKLC